MNPLKQQACQWCWKCFVVDCPPTSPVYYASLIDSHPTDTLPVHDGAQGFQPGVEGSFGVVQILFLVASTKEYGHLSHWIFVNVDTWSTFYPVWRNRPDTSVCMDGKIDVIWTWKWSWKFIFLFFKGNIKHLLWYSLKGTNMTQEVWACPVTGGLLARAPALSIFVAVSLGKRLHPPLLLVLAPVFGSLAFVSVPQDGYNVAYHQQCVNGWCRKKRSGDLRIR